MKNSADNVHKPNVKKKYVADSVATVNTIEYIKNSNDPTPKSDANITESAKAVLFRLFFVFSLNCFINLLKQFKQILSIILIF